jgi:electron transfer flavoprotein beta subunit
MLEGKAMRILSVIRQVLDAEENVKIREDKVDMSGSKVVVDTMDEYGVEEALRLREKLTDVEVIVLAVGSARSEEALRTTLAFGADRAILVEAVEPLDVIAVSSVVAKIAQREQVDLVITGGQQADWDSQALGAATAERLNWPQATWTTRLSVEDWKVTVTHDVDEGAETFSASLPMVITTQQGLNEPRYPTLPNIMKAKKKELLREPLESFGISTRVRLVRAELQVKERRRTVIDGKDTSAAATQLVDLLRSEAKVIA